MLDALVEGLDDVFLELRRTRISRDHRLTVRVRKLCASPGETPSAIAVNTSPKEPVLTTLLIVLPSLCKNVSSTQQDDTERQHWRA